MRGRGGGKRAKQLGEKMTNFGRKMQTQWGKHAKFGKMQNFWKGANSCGKTAKQIGEKDIFGETSPGQSVARSPIQMSQSLV